MSSATPLQLLHASPDAALLAGTCGLVLIALELNRPGRILPGSAGLLLVLFAIAILSQSPFEPWAVALVLVCFAILLANVWLRIAVWALVLTTAGLTVGLCYLLAPSAVRPIHPAVSIGCGLFLGTLLAVLSRIALRARRAKQVN